MSKIVIAGDAIVLTSALKLSDLKTIQKYRPKALTLMGGEDGKEPVFTLYVTDQGEGSISNNGAIFTSETRDDEKLATLTMVMPGVHTDNIKEYVADKIGGAQMSLNKLEATLGSVLEEIAADKQAVMESISIAQ